MKIAIVSSQKITVNILRNILAQVGSYKVVWTAYRGLDAIKNCSLQTPDLILMDLITPDSLLATQIIMQKTPCAILVITSDLDTNLGKIIEALSHGALDVINKSFIDTQWTLIPQSEILKRIEIISRLLGKAGKIFKFIKEDKYIEKRKEYPALAVVGASTGGPRALVQILSAFPKTLPLAVLVIQHVDELFTPGLVYWLGQQTEMKVELAKTGSHLTSGTILVAGKNQHLVLTEALELKYDNNKTSDYLPSIDVCFQSIANHWPKPFVGVLLTGMGSDGARGLKALFDKGWYTIAQDQKSSVVFGMPKAAIALQAATEVLPIKDIGTKILMLLENFQ